jgi:hypothetical protein
MNIPGKFYLKTFKVTTTHINYSFEQETISYFRLFTHAATILPYLDEIPFK